MKKILLLMFLIFIVLVFMVLGILFGTRSPSEPIRVDRASPKVEAVRVQKMEILRVALLADSEDDNEKLTRAIDQIRVSKVDFAVFLGDLTRLGEVQKLEEVQEILDKSGVKYYVTAGDHDLWAARNDGKDAHAYFDQVFGHGSQVVKSKNVVFTILDNSDIYKGISDEDWLLLKNSTYDEGKLHFVLAHKTPFHPQSSHVMGAENPDVARQAKELMVQLEEDKIDGFFSGDLHFFAQFSSKEGATSSNNLANGVKITTIGAVSAERNFQGPRFAIMKVFDDYTWEVEDREIR